MVVRQGGCTKCLLYICAIIAAAGMKLVMAEEGESNAVGVSVAATLIGAISFIMCLYYFLNWGDEDIERYSWELVSQTISIFCAVLLFQSFNDLVEAYVIEYFELRMSSECAVDLIHFLFWYICLQVTLCVLSGALGGIDKIKHLSPLQQEADKDRREINLKCFAVLLAHLTGFASINAWGSVQHLPFFRQSPCAALLAVPMALVGQVSLQRVTDLIRNRISLMGDGFRDTYERMWDDETAEAENDVMGLTLSFLVTNALRYAVTGCFPNQEGKEEADGIGCVEGEVYTHTARMKALMCLLAVFFGFAVFLIRVTLPDWVFIEEEEDSDEEVVMAAAPTESDIEQQRQQAEWEFIKRLAESLFTAITMSFSWCAFFGLQMILKGYELFRGESNDELAQVVLALSLSYGVFAIIVTLDKIADAGQAENAARWQVKGAEGVRNVMDSCSLLVGFAWEQCFDQSVDSLAEEAKPGGVLGDFLNPHTAKLLLSLFCASLLVPAWRNYMLPYIVAKGWRYGWVTHPDHLGKVAMKMIEHPDIAPNSKKQRDRIKRIQSGLQGISYLGIGEAEETKQLLDIYHSLPSDEVGALRKENAQLKLELSRAKRELDLKSHALDAISTINKL